MKPETAAYFASARELVRRAPALLKGEFTDEAARAAYMASFHAAQALIFERENRVLKTHRGVHSEFVQIVRDDPRFADGLRGFLGRAYSLKAVADYQSGPGAKISFARASDAVATAQRFVEAVERALA